MTYDSYKLMSDRDERPDLCDCGCSFEWDDEERRWFCPSCLAEEAWQEGLRYEWEVNGR